MVAPLAAFPLRPTACARNATDGTGQFGFLESEDDPEIFAALFNAAGDWLKAKGFTRVQGPFSFSMNDETGLLIDGFNRPPYVFMGHAPRYYGPRIEEQGFIKTKDVIVYDYDARVDPPPSMQRLYTKALKSDQLLIRALDKKELKRDLDIIISIFNDAWSENWGFVPFTREEITPPSFRPKHLCDSMISGMASLITSYTFACGANLAYGGRLGVLKEFLHDTGCFSPALARKIVDFDCPGDGVIHSEIEQEPNPDSRVSLVDDVNSFGLRRVQMNWQLSNGDLKTIRTLSIKSAKEMARLNRARVQLAPIHSRY